MTSRHRLRGRSRFAAVRSGGARASSAGVRAQLVRNDLAVSRVGFALVGLGSAVRRNRLRRRLREAMRPLLVALAGHDVVIVAGAEAAGLSPGALSEAVRTATSRALARWDSVAPASRADNGHMGSQSGDGR